MCDCSNCEYEEDTRGCVLKHVGNARKLLAQGDIKGADQQLSCVERHLK
ncbi:MAG: hypothetical protein ACFFCO_13330 [Promethearchaeota archaeon]